MEASTTDLSFVIPAYNEEGNIRNTLRSIYANLPENLSVEILVIDHGSHDGTASIAKESGATVHTKTTGTVAGLRNYGANLAKGKVLVFLDADVHLTPQWCTNIPRILIKIEQGDNLLTGSWVSVPEHSTWLERYWFEPQQNKQNTHINSGHMIIGRTQFFRLGGFNEKLETGEDYEISMRAKKMGFVVQEEHDLKVIHEGYPKTLIEFVKREFWHGKGDASSLRVFFGSKVALLSVFFLILHLAVVLAAALHYNSAALISLVLLIFLLCLFSSFSKFKAENIATIIIDSGVYYFYFWSRAVSLLKAFAGSGYSKRQR